MTASKHQRHELRAVAHDVRQLHELEHEGESEWTPLLALVGLVVFLVTVFLLVLGTVEGASHLLN